MGCGEQRQGRGPLAAGGLGRQRTVGVSTRDHTQRPAPVTKHGMSGAVCVAVPALSRSHTGRGTQKAWIWWQEVCLRALCCLPARRAPTLLCTCRHPGDGANDRNGWGGQAPARACRPCPHSEPLAACLCGVCARTWVWAARVEEMREQEGAHCRCLMPLCVGA